jgi:beta-phosphoglucomutase-like phosphatase (HAD superfamily)
VTRAGLAASFDLILGGDQVTNPKPAPDLYLRAAELLDAEPATCIALEDSPTGVASARAAGMFVIGIPSLPTTVLDVDLLARSLEDPEVWQTFGAHAPLS